MGPIRPWQSVARRQPYARARSKIRSLTGAVKPCWTLTLDGEMNRGVLCPLSSYFCDKRSLLHPNAEDFSAMLGPSWPGRALPWLIYKLLYAYLPIPVGRGDVEDILV